MNGIFNKNNNSHSMIAHKLQEMIKKHAARARMGPPPMISSTIIVGKRMVLEGCEAIVSLASNNSELRSQQRRVILQGIGPGDVLRVPGRFYETIVTSRRLPKSFYCRLWGAGGNKSIENKKENKRRGRWGPPRVIPCQHHTTTRACPRCPWMGLSIGASREIKSEQLRQALEPFLLYKDENYVEINNSGEKSSSWPPTPLRFLEPFDIPIAAHSMREVEFHFKHPLGDEKIDSNPKVTNTENSGKFCFSTESSNAPDCFLCTLEQQRLLLSLNRWAEKLPQPIQLCLRSVFILQHQQDEVVHSWERDIHVTIFLNQNKALFGDESPLGSPSQPEGLPSLVEQQLIDAIISVLPLTKRIGIATLCNDGSVRYLYPYHKRLDYSIATEIIEKEFIKCNSIFIPTGKKITANLPFIHSTIAFALGEKYLSYLELPFPSIWRHLMSIEAVGSVLISLIDGNIQNDDKIVLINDYNYKDHSSLILSHVSGSRLLGKVILEWLKEVFKIPVIHIKRSEKLEGKKLIEMINLKFKKERNYRMLLFYLLSTDADVTTVGSIFRESLKFLHLNSFEKPNRIVLIQVTNDSNFNLLANALRIIRLNLNLECRISMDCGIIDIDPWTSASVGYLMLEFSSSSTS